MKKVLMVEDHADIRRLVRMSLEFENYVVYEASSGRTGLEAANAMRPDLVLLDVMMPGDMDGLEVCRKIRAMPGAKPCRVVMLSARGMLADREAGIHAGADAYLVKPFSPLQLIQVINDLLAEPTGTTQ